MPPSTESAPARRTRVLFVEDHAGTRLAIGKLLQRAGADVTTARDGGEGLNHLLARQFDVLLTDLQMPVMDGFELLRQAVKLPDARRPAKMIALSGEYGEAALDGFGVGFLSKPFALDKLLELLGGKLN